MTNAILAEQDPQVFAIIKKEEQKQQDKLSMIPSENFFSPAVREATASVFAHKYAEGNIGGRYYEGNYYVDELEQLTIDRALKLFNCPADWYANVQALGGSNANQSVYLGLLNPGDTMLAMYLPDGGHLSHGWSFEPDKAKRIEDVDSLEYLGGSRKVNISSRLYNVIQYKVDPQTQRFDYDEVEKIALKHQPKLIITGGTAYPSEIAYQRMRQIADKVGALYMADIAHEAGLIAAGANASPVGIADIVTMTTHKTLRSGRGAIILGKAELIKKINRGVLPGLQGGPFNHCIAGICVGLGEALQPEFKEYAHQVVKNAKALAEELKKYDFELVSGGTEKHLILIDLTNKGVFGKKFARALDHAGIIANMNGMPQDTRPPADPSALRLGTPWITTRGMKETEMPAIAAWIDRVAKLIKPWAQDEFVDFEAKVIASSEIQAIAQEVKELCKRFPQEM